MRSICMEVAGMLEEVATTAGDDLDDETPERIPTAERFAAAVQACLEAAEDAGLSTEDDPYRCNSALRQHRVDGSDSY